MIGKNLPEKYEGYSTRELLDMWGGGGPLRIPKGAPKEKIGAMRDLLREFKIAPIFWDNPEKYQDNLKALQELFESLGLKLNPPRA